MSDNDKLPLPLGLCNECQRKAVDSGIHYCEENNSGAVYLKIDNLCAWLIYTPMAKEVFQAIIKLLPLAEIKTTLRTQEQRRTDD